MSHDTAAKPLAGDAIAGMAAMTAAMACFIVSDVGCKIAAGHGLPVGQVIALRGSFSILLMLVPVLVAHELGLIAQRFSRIWSLRIAGEMVAAIAFISTLVHMPLAHVVAITQTIPLAITAAGALLLGETVGWRRWLATFVGFGGVLLIVRPGTEAFSWWSLGALLSVLAVTVRDIMTRRMPADISSAAITLTTAAGVAVSGFGMGFVEGAWILPSPAAIAALAVAAAAIAAGYVFSIHAVRAAPLSTIAPFRYTIIPMSLLLGYLIWGEVPDTLALLGIAVIAAAGIYTFARERRLRTPSA